VFAIITLGVLCSLIIGAQSISPGSLIVYESAMTYFFTKFGAPIHAALIITFLYRFLTFWSEHLIFNIVFSGFLVLLMYQLTTILHESD